MKPSTFNKKALRQDIKLVLILISLISVPVLISLSVPQDNLIQVPISADTLDSLSQDYRKQGLEGYLKSKKSLKRRVSRQLENSKDPRVQLAATNIAVYLFPDLLPNDSFEKQLAEESFVPLQSEIEKSPGTSEAEALYEELRARVWNYENPKNSEQGLSEYANQMLKIYGALVWK
jgi:hypothetical protein